MSWLDELQNVLQKPQSAYAGTLLGLERIMGQGGLDDSIHPEAGNPLTGLVAGLKGNIHPRDVLQDMSPAYEREGIGRKVLKGAVDIGWDPLMAAGPIAKSGALGAKAAEGAGLAMSAGKIDDAKMATHLARGLRRVYQSSLAASNPMEAVQAALLQGVTENSLAKWGPSVIAKIMRRSPELSDETGGAVKSAVQVAQGGLDDLLGADPRAALARTRSPTVTPSDLESVLAANPATSRDLSTVLRPTGRHFASGQHFGNEASEASGAVGTDLVPENDLDDVFASALGTQPVKILMDPMIKNQGDV